MNFKIFIALVFILLLTGCNSSHKVSVHADTFLFTGDIMLGRFVETLMNRYGNDYPFTGFELGKVDYTVVNLEGPIPITHTQTPDFTTNFSFKPDVAGLLKSNGVDIVTLANNHTFDKGDLNFKNTQKTLKEAGLMVFGHPRQLNNDSYTVIDNKYLLIGLNEAVSSYFDSEESIKFIQELDAKHPELFMIINIHWGTEYELVSNEKQKYLARAYIDNGADLIIGHHPHVVQEIEMYKNKLIFYSLGNYIFDQYFSADTQQGLAVELKIYSAKKVSFKLIPLEIIKSQPTKMAGEKREKFLKELYNRSLNL